MLSQRLILLPLLACFLIACSGQPIKKKTINAPDQTVKALSPIEQVLQNIERSQHSADKNRFLMQAADLLLTEQNFRQADQLLRQVSIADLSYAEQEQYILLHLTTAVELNDAPTINQLLKLVTPGFVNKAPIGIQQKGNITLSKAYDINNQPLNAASTLIEASGLYNEEQYWHNHERIWNLLKETPPTTLTEQLPTTQHYDTQGWLALSLAMHQHQINLESQLRALENWLQLWPAHPAAMKPPKELELLKNLPTYRPKHIALTLPLSGPLKRMGEAVRDGFLAAYYSDHHNSQPDIRITVHDTHNREFSNLYEEISLTKPDLIVGPLEKESLSWIKSNPTLPIPVLGLNYLESPTPETSPFYDFYQFGLSVEHELQQISDYLWQQGARRVLTFLPDNKWGQRSFQDFQQAWSKHNGEVADYVFYGTQDKLSDLVENALLVQNSKQRYRDLQRITGERFEFYPRRRRDIDAIVLISTPEIARQIKPLFAFHYAGDIPIISTSHVYAGLPNPQKDHDLNGIRFTEIPWSLSQSNAIRTELRKHQLNENPGIDRLYALGVDSYKLAPRLPLLKQIKGSRMQGETGILHMDIEGKIIRTLDWATFKDGRAQQQSL